MVKRKLLVGKNKNWSFWENYLTLCKQSLASYEQTMHLKGINTSRILGGHSKKKLYARLMIWVWFDKWTEKARVDAILMLKVSVF